MQRMALAGKKSGFKLLKISLSVLLLAIAWRSPAQDFLSLGARGGVSFNGGLHRFWQAETFAKMDLPWKWDFYSDWRFQPAVDVSAGWLRGERTDAFIGTAGPVLELSKGKFPLKLEGGSSPTYLSRNRFGAKNFGDRFQFTSHIGVVWDITEHLSVGYRFQHMSNAGIANPNPGLNLQMISVSYRF
jgi:lipid A 3-O-deacylase